MSTQGIQRSIIMIGVLILLVFFGYTLIRNEGGSIDNQFAQSNIKGGEDILALVETLKKITIDKTLFTSDLFLGLKDYSVTLNPEPQGRPNPFANIGVDSDVSSQNRVNVSKQTQ